MRVFLRTFCVPALAVVLLMAMSFIQPSRADWDNDDFSDFADDMASEMKAFEEEADADVEAFLAEADRDFLEFLRDAWKDLEEFEGIPSPLKPKPKVLPKAPKAPETSKPEPDKTPVVKLPEPVVVTPQASPVKGAPSKTPSHKGGSSKASGDKATPAKGAAGRLSPGKAAPSKASPSKATPSKSSPGTLSFVETEDDRLKVAVNWMGQELTFRCDPQSRHPLRGDVNPQAIAEFWEHQAKLDYQDILEQLYAAKQGLLLNDWGYVRLVWSFARELQPATSEANLYGWFLLTKSGYRARLGYGDGKAYLLAAADNTIYGVPYYTVKGTRYFNLSYMDGEPRPNLMRTYDGEYAGAENGLDLQLRQIPRANAKENKRQLAFKYDGKKYSVPVVFSEERVNFFHAYPQTDIPIFFQAAVSGTAEQSLVKGLAPLIEGRTERDAVNLLLRFVQTAFEYKTDHQQFGKEKYLFVEETLRFPYSDCEDRSIIFSYLVKRLTGLDVVALKYPNHIATAVRFRGPVKGTTVNVQGETYVICDPTYINASVGMEMPQFKNVDPEVMRIML